MKKLRVAVIGCGYWAPNIVRVLLGLEGVGVAALCDVDLGKAQDLAGRFSLQPAIVADYRQVCSDPSLDAVFVVTPIPTHHELVLEAIRCGKHVFVEKPMAETVAECEELIRSAEEQDVVLMVGQIFEYNSAVIRIKQYLESEELGRLLYIYSQRVNLGRIQNDVNALWSYAPHDISILNYWLEAEPNEVSARGFRCLGQAVEDVVFVILEYPNGVGVHLHLGWMDPRKIRRMTLVGSKKMLVYDDVSIDARIQIYDKGIDNLDEYIRSPDSYAEFQYQIREADLIIPRVKFEEPLREECRHFVECVWNGEGPRTDGRSGARVVRALQAAQRSLESGGVTVEVASRELGVSDLPSG